MDQDSARCGVFCDGSVPHSTMCTCSNAILLCDGNGCAVAVHQQCYGVASLPQGDWRCDGCEAGLDPAARHCLLCPAAGGALRSVASMGTVVPHEGERGTFFWKSQDYNAIQFFPSAVRHFAFCPGVHELRETTLAS